jgi:hypothetical protein
MKPTPSALKWLAEKRARLAFDLAQTERIARDVSHRLENLRMDMAGLDRTLQVFDATIDPNSIEPVHAHRRKGAHGALRGAVVELLQANAPAWTSTDVVELFVRSKLSLSFETTVERKRWYDNVLTKQLRTLVADGLAERQQDPTVFTAEVGRWRWKAEVVCNLSQLREL